MSRESAKPVRERGCARLNTTWRGAGLVPPEGLVTCCVPRITAAFCDLQRGQLAAILRVTKVGVRALDLLRTTDPKRRGGTAREGR